MDFLEKYRGSASTRPLKKELQFWGSHQTPELMNSSWRRISEVADTLGRLSVPTLNNKTRLAWGMESWVS